MTKDNDIAISVQNVSKTFKLPHEKQTSLKGAFLKKVKQGMGYEMQEALKDVSFEVKKGEFFGIVGRNGSGKSTLLKCMAGVYSPTKGKIHVNGTLVPFIELGVGFNPELSGRDNVFLNGALLGFSRKQMEAMYDEIVEFAELEQFMDQKLKNYSSGMQVRLAFSIAIQAKGDVLLLDEVLAVGDAAFQEKCQDFFASQKNKRTMILVTHDMNAIEKYCNRAMLINGGELVKVSTSDEISLLYKDMFAKEKDLDNKKKNEEAIKKQKKDVVNLESIEVFQSGIVSQRIKALESFILKIKIQSEKTYNNTVLGINMLDSRNNMMLATSTRKLKPTVGIKKGITEVAFDVQNIFTDGDYTINVAISDEEKNGKLLMQVPRAFTFNIQGIEVAKHSLTHPEINVTVS